jgi:hypothetical protein
MIQKMLSRFSWKRRRAYGETRVVDCFLWWPRTLDNPDGETMETRCWCRAKIVQEYKYWVLGGEFSGGWYDERWYDSASTDAQD